MRVVMKQLIAVLLIVGVVTLIASSAQAETVLITNGATTLLDDDFESHTFGLAPPGPWTINTSQPSDIVRVTNAAVPGANQGFNYAQLHRSSGGIAQLKAPFTSQSSGTLHVELAVYSASGSMDGGTSVAGLYLVADAGGGVYMTLAETGAVAVYDGSVYNTVGGLTWATDDWKDVEIDYTLGATTATITIDGVSATPTIWQTSTLDYFMAHVSTQESTMYIDGITVPEPAVLSMLAVAVGSVLLIRRRSVK